MKAQQYAVLVTDVNPASRAIQNPGGHLSLNRAAENEVARAFQSLFDDFIAAVPVRYHAKVDKLLRCLDQAQVMLLRIDDRLENSRANSKKAQNSPVAGDELEREMKLLVRDIARAQGDAHLDYRSGLSYFVMFKSQVSAAIAAQTLIQERAVTSLGMSARPQPQMTSTSARCGCTPDKSGGDHVWLRLLSQV